MAVFIFFKNGRFWFLKNGRIFLNGRFWFLKNGRFFISQKWSYFDIFSKIGRYNVVKMV